MPVHRSRKQEHSSKTDRLSLALPLLGSQWWQTGKGHVIITLKIRRLFLPYRDRQQPEHRSINFKKEATAAHMLPGSDLRESFPNTRKNISVGNIFFKNSNFPALLSFFFFFFFILSSYHLTSIEHLRHAGCTWMHLLIPLFIHSTTKYWTNFSVSNPIKCWVQRAETLPLSWTRSRALVLSQWLLSAKLLPRALWSSSHLWFTAILGQFYRWEL